MFTIKWDQYPAFIELRDTIFTIQWDQYPAFIDSRNTIFTIKWEQYPAFIDTGHYTYNKIGSVPKLYRYETLYLQ